MFDWHELALFDADVFGTRADDAVVGSLFEYMRRPACQARADENRGEQLGRDAHEVVRRRMVEVGVREQFLLLPHGLVDGFGNRDMFAGMRDFFGGRSQTLERALKEARIQATDEIKERAQALQADAVVGLDFEISMPAGKGGMVVVFVTGTAVKLR